MRMDMRKEKVSFSNGLVWMLSHCRPKPCSSYRERYSVPKPKATWDNKLCRGRRRRGRLQKCFTAAVLEMIADSWRNLQQPASCSW